MSSGLIAVLVAVGAVMALLVAGLRRVPDGHCFTVNRLGRYHRTLQPGWHLVLPLIDRVTRRISTAGSVLTVNNHKLTTRDHQAVVATGNVYLQVLDPRKAAYQPGDLDRGAEALTRSCTEELVNQLTLRSLQEHTSLELNSFVMSAINETSQQWGVRVTRVELRFTSDPGDTDP